MLQMFCGGLRGSAAIDHREFEQLTSSEGFTFFVGALGRGIICVGSRDRRLSLNVTAPVPLVLR
jgi:hypothetical protein